MPYDFDLITVGAGSGGVAASRRAATLGARVAVIEADRPGGTCVLRGCVPKKLLSYAAQLGEGFEDAAGFGWSVDGKRHDWPTLLQRKNAEVARLSGVYASALEKAGCRLFHARATLVDPHTVDLGGERLTARVILVATGARPHVPNIPGREHFVTSDEALEFPKLPERLVVSGAGYIGVELSCIFRALGSRVTLLARGGGVLPAFDHDVRKHLGLELAKRGVEVRSATMVERIERSGGALVVHTPQGPLEADAVLAATGRWPSTGQLGLEALGVQLDARGGIGVDAYSRTAVESVYAIGDVTNRMALTPVAIAEGRAFAETVFGSRPVAIDYSHVPTAVFSSPPVGCVGMTEEGARSRGHDVDVYASTFRPMKHTLSGRDERTFMKLVVDRATDRVLGCHIVGMDAPEIVQPLAIALVCGATKRQFDRTVALHPTSAEELVLMREKRA
jgi:glutathione reductase (NADPH)